MYQKAQFCRNLRKENSTVTCGFSPTKIHFSDYLKRLISRINEVYVFSNKIKYRYRDILLKKKTYRWYKKVSKFDQKIPHSPIADCGEEPQNTKSHETLRRQLE